MPVEEAVIDSPITEEVVVETPAVESSVVETQTEIEGDNRELPGWVKALQNIDHKGYKDARENFFSKRKMDERLKDFDLDGVKGWLDQEGGRDAISGRITDLSTKAEALDQITQLAEQGDVSLLDRLPEGSISKLGPAMIDRYAQADPEGWKQQAARVVAAEIQGFPLHMEKMVLELGLLKDVIASEQNPSPYLVRAFNNLSTLTGQLKDWTGMVQQTASTQPVAKAPAGAESWKTDKANWEAEKFTESANTKIEDFRNKEIAKQIKDYVARDPKDADKQQTLVDLIRTKVIQRMDADKGFQKDVKALAARRDMEGVIKLISNREAKAIVEIAPSQGRIIYGQPSVAKVTPQTTAAPTSQPQRTSTKPLPNSKEAKLAAMFS